MPQNSVTITIEGVMQKIVSYAPIPSGLVLYHGLASVYQVILLSDYPKDDVDRWLNLEGLNKHATVLYTDPVTQEKAAPERRLAQVNNLRARGYAIDFCIEPDPVVSAALLASGVSVLNFLHTFYALPQWRPDFDTTPRPWHSIEAEMNRTKFLRNEDRKLKIEEGQ